MQWIIRLIVVGIGLLLGVNGWASSDHPLTADEVLLICNARHPYSRQMADYYARARKVPAENLVSVTVDEDESCSRAVYDQAIRSPVRQKLAVLSAHKTIRCLLILPGLPLRVHGPDLNADAEKQRQHLEDQKTVLIKVMAGLRKEDDKIREKLTGELADLEQQVRLLSSGHRQASLDSELALIRFDTYDLAGWLPNPLFVGFAGQRGLLDRSNVLLVSRLDGPSEQIVRRIIDDSLAVEEAGLRGAAYFDARWPETAGPGGDGTSANAYQRFDQTIHRAADQVRRDGRLTVVLDDAERLFQDDECPYAALYCGWYSLARYVSAFQWRKGAVGYHIASAECTTLIQPDSQVWCKRLLEEGVAATIGPVAEPYIQAFPLPDVFFTLLLDGQLTLAECYMLSLPYLSWQMVLIGDPLYRPFQRNLSRSK